MRAVAATAMALATCALLVAGCGGDSDEEQITALFNSLFAAQDAGDAETACREIYVIQEPPPPGSEELSGEQLDEAEAESEEREAEGEGGEEGIEECEAAFEQADARRRSEITNLSTEVGTIEVDGDRATAIVHTELTRRDGSELSQEAPYDLVRTDDGWRIRISEEG